MCVMNIFKLHGYHLVARIVYLMIRLQQIFKYSEESSSIKPFLGNLSEFLSYLI